MCFLRFLMQARATVTRYLPEASAASLQSCSAGVSGMRKLHIVICNESCDLDSAVSALTLAFIYSKRHEQNDYVPVLNIPRMDYPLKTEVGHMFKKCGIVENMLLFRDDLPKKLVATDFNVILVDHHVSPLARNVIEIFDHRPIEDNPVMKQLPAACVSNIEPEVGSCATLISERLYAEEQPRSEKVMQLLYATIVLDTINLSTAAKRFCARDVAMIEQLEQSLYGENPENIEDMRRDIFDELVAARADISQLKLEEVLRKDMKMVTTQRQAVPMAGIPMLVRDFIEKHEAEDAVRAFAAGSKLLVILGMYVSPENGQVQRDIGLISLTGQSQLVERVKHALLQFREPSFDLQPHELDFNFMGGSFLSQHNVQATRKHILPVVKGVLEDWEAAHDCDEVYFFKEKPKLSLS